MYYRDQIFRSHNISVINREIWLVILKKIGGVIG